MRQDAFQCTTLVQQHRATWHDRFIKKNHFHIGDWTLLYDSKFKDFKVKFIAYWLGLYET